MWSFNLSGLGHHVAKSPTCQLPMGSSSALAKKKKVKNLSLIVSNTSFSKKFFFSFFFLVNVCVDKSKKFMELKIIKIIIIIKT